MWRADRFLLVAIGRRESLVVVVESVETVRNWVRYCLLEGCAIGCDVNCFGDSSGSEGGYSVVALSFSRNWLIRFLSVMSELIAVVVFSILWMTVE